MANGELLLSVLQLWIFIQLFIGSNFQPSADPQKQKQEPWKTKHVKAASAIQVQAVEHKHISVHGIWTNTLSNTFKPMR